MSVAVLIPVLDRPQRVEPLLASLAGDTPTVAYPVFLCSQGDTAQIDACRARAEFGQVSPASWAHTVVVPWPATRGDYARKMNYGMRLARERGDEWVFLGADDLRFSDGWLDAALACHERTRACVIGTNDLGNSRVTAGDHSTHTLVHVDYLDCGTIDEDGVVLHEGYWHNFVDNEFVETAVHRQTWAHATDAVVEHLHPNWRKADQDDTYRRGQAHFEEDRQLHATRRHLWAGTWR